MIVRSSRANIAADLAAVAALRAARFALRLMPQRTFFASAFAFAHALSAATTAHFAAITAASHAKVANARSVLALALRRRSAPLFFFFALALAFDLDGVSCAPRAKDPKERLLAACLLACLLACSIAYSYSWYLGGEGLDPPLPVRLLFARGP